VERRTRDVDATFLDGLARPGFADPEGPLAIEHVGQHGLEVRGHVQDHEHRGGEIPRQVAREALERVYATR
jgi:hypothetical protein